jgi:hypothetical protein
LIDPTTQMLGTLVLIQVVQPRSCVASIKPEPTLDRSQGWLPW